MEAEIKSEIEKCLEGNIIKIVISNPKDKTSLYKKISINPIMLKGILKYQITSYTEKQAFQKNVGKEELPVEILKQFPQCFVQISIALDDMDIDYKISKKGKLLCSRRKKISGAAQNHRESLAHNRKKNYIIQEGMIIPPLIDMGIFTREGKIVNSMYDKFKQINRFIEMVDDVIKNHNRDEINIIDFGCGKSYLTFLIYYYLVECKGLRANITGLDLKADVIDKCNHTAKKYGYSGLTFKLGDINGYDTDMNVDMVITLHACDTATDYALYNAVRWNAAYIMSVPCCQHEVNKNISSDKLAPMMKYGIIKERTSALATDALRGAMLEYRGYKVCLMEFVDMAHSPKNILIRAIKGNVSKQKREQALREAKEMCSFFGIEPSIYRLLGERSI